MPDRGEAAPSILGIDRRKALLTAAAAVFLAVAAATLIGRIADWQEVLDRLGRADWRWLLVAAGGLPVAYAGYVLGYRELATSLGGPSLGYWTSTQVVVLGLGAGVLGSSPSGLAVDLWALHRAGAEFHDAARRVLALHTLRWGVLGSFAGLAGAAALAAGGAPTGMALGWLLTVPVAVAAAAWVGTADRRDRIAPPAGAAPASRGRRPAAWAAWSWAKLRRGSADALGGLVVIRRLLSRPHRHAALAGFPLFWLGDVLVLYGALRAFDHVPGVPGLILAYATAQVLKSIPLPAGGAGIAEATLASTLAVVGTPLSAAILAAFAYRVISFWIPVLVAVVFLPVLRSLPDELDQVASAA